MTSRAVIEFGEWMPDQQDLVGGVTVAKNVLPYANGFIPFPSGLTYSDALTAYCRGAVTARAKDETVYNYAGDATKLYTLTHDAWGDATRSSGGNYATGSGERWEFTEWRGDKILATNYSDEIQLLTMGGANFADLGGTPPQARHIATVRNFVVLGNTQDNGTGNPVPNRVWWSGINDETKWTVSSATQCDNEDLPTGDWIERIFGGDYGVIFQTHAIWRMTYVGLPTIWQFDQVVPGTGLLAPGAAAQYDDTIFYLSQTGFEAISGGAQVTPIGAQKVDRFVLDDIDTNYLDRVSCAVDVVRKKVLWSYPGSGATGGRANKIVAYDWTTGRWSYAEVDVEVLVKTNTTGYTLDTLDNVNSSIDALPFSLDNRAWSGGQAQLGYFDSAHKLTYFNGTPMSATIETQEFALHKGRRAMLINTRPLVDGGTTTIQVGTRARQANTTTWTSASSMTTQGRCPVRVNSRYHRLRANISGTWTHAMGVEVEGARMGWF